MSLADSKLHFAAAELSPSLTPTPQPPPLLTADVQERLAEIADHLWRHGIHRIPQKRPDKATAAVLPVLAGLEVLGAVVISRDQDETLVVKSITPFSIGFVRTYIECLRHRLPIIDNWQVTSEIPNTVSGSALLRTAELQRIEGLKARGLRPNALSERRVALVVIKGRTVFGKSLFLFDYNRNWDMFNFIGGKEEAIDAGNPESIAKRELEEELGVHHDSVRLIDLTPKGWIETRSTLGRNGVLVAYSARIYVASLDAVPPLRGRQQWFDKAEVESQTGHRGERFLVHPAYFDHLRHLPGGLDGIPNSFSSKILPPGLKKGLHFIQVHKKAIVAVLAVISAIIGLVKPILSLIGP